MPSPRPTPDFTAIEHYENFPVASYLCPASLRGPIAALYHFARTADDIADEGEQSAQQRLATLQAYRQALMDISTHQPAPAHAPPQHAWPHIFGPLQHTMHSQQLPVQLLHDLLDAFVQDVEKTRDATGYATETQLLDYCRRSANPIGRLLLHLYQIQSPQALLESDFICSALQLINFWQDLSVDIPRGRYYLAHDMCQSLGLNPTKIPLPQEAVNATKLIAQCVYFARHMMRNGMPLVHKIPGRAGWELRLVVQGGLRVLEKIEKAGGAVFTQRPTLRWWDAPVMLWRAVWM